MIWSILRRDLRALLPGSGSHGAWLPLLFFISVAMLFPFAVGPDAPLLAKTGGGVLWVAALLAAILPVERLVADDLQRGFYDQLVVRGVSEEAAMASRLLAHWLSFAPLLLIASLPASALLSLDGATVQIILLGLLVGTPGLAAIGLVIAALTAGMKGGAALTGLLLVPLAVPILIFGAGSITRGDLSGIALCAAISLLLVAIAPFAAGAGLRAAREG